MKETKPCINLAQSLKESLKRKKQFFSAMMDLDILDSLYTSEAHMRTLYPTQLKKQACNPSIKEHINLNNSKYTKRLK